jgi:hypothetical protein
MKTADIVMTQKRRVPPLLMFLLLAAVLGILAVEPVRAGCCLVLSLDELPDSIVAGEPVTFSYTARLVTGQGHVPYPSQEMITAVHAESKERVTVEAEPINNEPGRFRATLIFPAAGAWQWQLGSRPMPPLQVQEALAVQEPMSENLAPMSAAYAISPALGILGLSVAAVGLIAWLRRRTPYRLALVVVAALIALGGLAARTAGTDTAAAGSQPAVAAIRPGDTGEALFVAKGCLSCHRHAGLTLIDSSGGGGFAPDLTHYQGHPDFLRRWLQDPKAIRPTTFMPNLELDAHEIEALVEFLSS